MSTPAKCAWGQAHLTLPGALPASAAYNVTSWMGSSNLARATFATTRVVLGEVLPNLQASWVKEGLDEAQTLLDWGANDLGGTLQNESISTAAGATHGQWVKPPELERRIRLAGRAPRQRTTLYA